MFTNAPSKTDLDVAIDKAFVSLSQKETTSEEYATTLDHIAKLHELKAAEKPSRVSPDTWALIGANLAGIILIIGHEKANVITTKAFGLLQRPR